MATSASNIAARPSAAVGALGGGGGEGAVGGEQGVELGLRRSLGGGGAARRSEQAISGEDETDHAGSPCASAEPDQAGDAVPR